MNVLLLGGTTEAAEIAHALANCPDMSVTISLAGRTSRPTPLPLPTRIGGFGGIPGLIAWLREHATDALIDATHPFAAQMAGNALVAAKNVGIPILRLERVAWTPQPGDRWTDVPDLRTAATALGPVPRRVFLTTGRKNLEPFVAAPWHRYVVRAVDAPRREELPPHTQLILGKGPFDIDAELALLREREIGVIVTKNSGGAATAAKLEAARVLGLPVVMVARPRPAGSPTVATVGEALDWLARHAALRRGV